MSLPAQNPAQQVVATSGQTVIPFSWRCDDSSLITVWVNDNLVGGWTPALNADQTASPGGSVVLATPSAAGDIVTVERVNPQTQNFALTAYNPFTAVALVAAMDRIVELVQEVFAKVARVFYVKRSMQAKIASFELPAPAVGQVLTWVSGDGGLTFSLGATTPSVIGVTTNATMVKNETPTGAVNGTNGSDGNAAFVLAHVPKSAGLLDVLLDGVRQPPSRYTLVGNTVTFNAGFIPITGSDIRADYFY